jgi:U3 small nucleolar RNA-associated protein MPP10
MMADLDDSRLEEASTILAEHPESFYEPKPELYETLIGATTLLYNATKQSEPEINLFGPFDELITAGFDLDQVWEEIQLLNSGVLNFVDQSLENLENCEPEAENDDVSEVDLEEDLSYRSGEDDEGENEDEDEGDDAVESAEDPDPMDVSALAELDESESDEGLELIDDKDESEGEEMNADEEAANLTYEDFYGVDAPKTELRDIELHADQLDEDLNPEDGGDDLNTKVSNLFEYSDDEEDEEFLEDALEADPSGDAVGKLEKAESADDADDAAIKSTYEKQSEEVNKQIEQLEFEAIQAKDWTLTGEVSSRSRPLNSLLEHDLEFDTVKKPVPIVSEEFTCTLEDLIKAKIIKREFDDVVRKIPVEKREYKPREDISVEKSKISLAEIYEEEYMKSTSANRSEKVVQALTAQHQEIDKMERDLFHKLDALSNFFFTPKPIVPDVQVVADVPAISVEEVIPAHVSDANMKAPHEIYVAPKNLKARNELSATERESLRQKAKVQKRKSREEAARTEEVVKKSKRTEQNQAIQMLLKEKVCAIAFV